MKSRPTAARIERKKPMQRPDLTLIAGLIRGDLRHWMLESEKGNDARFAAVSAMAGVKRLQKRIADRIQCSEERAAFLEASTPNG